MTGVSSGGVTTSRRFSGNPNARSHPGQQSPAQVGHCLQATQDEAGDYKRLTRKKGRRRRAQPWEVGTSLHTREAPSPEASGAVEVALGHMHPARRSWLLPAAPGTGCGGREPRGARRRVRRSPGGRPGVVAVPALPEEPPARSSIGATIWSLEG